MTEQMAIEYLLNRYLVVGSPVNPPKEECEKHNAVLDMAIKALEKQSMINEILNEMWALNEISKDYSAIGTLEEFKELKEKATPKKPKLESYGVFACPICGEKVGHKLTEIMTIDRREYCDCGQRIDWE